jgi:hypothetical protein
MRFDPNLSVLRQLTDNLVLSAQTARPAAAGFHDREDLWLPQQPGPFVIMDIGLWAAKIFSTR